MLPTKTERSIYKQLRDECHPLIEHYHTDLTQCDRKTIQNNPGVPFLHWTRSMGTHLVMLYPAENYPPQGVFVQFLFGQADRMHMLDAVLSMAQSHSAERTILAHYYDGKKLHVVTADRAVTIAREYRQSVLNQWERAPSKGTSNPFCGN